MENNTYILTVTYQPINKCWGVLFRRGNAVQNFVDESLGIAMDKMSEFIKEIRIQGQ